MFKFLKIITKGFWKYIKAVFIYLEDHITLKEIRDIIVIIQSLEGKKLTDNVKLSVAFNTIKEIFKRKDLLTNFIIQLIKVFIKSNIIKANPDKKYNIIEKYILENDININELSDIGKVGEELYKKGINMSLKEISKYIMIFQEFNKYLNLNNEK